MQAMSCRTSHPHSDMYTVFGPAPAIGFRLAVTSTFFDRAIYNIHNGERAIVDEAHNTRNDAVYGTGAREADGMVREHNRGKHLGGFSKRPVHRTQQS